MKKTPGMTLRMIPMCGMIIDWDQAPYEEDSHDYDYEKIVESLAGMSFRVPSAV